MVMDVVYLGIGSVFFLLSIEFVQRVFSGLRP